MNLDLIFKAYDVRGIYGTELTEDIAYKTARGYARLIQGEHPGKILTCVVGQDMRVSSPSLEATVVQGLVDSGINVVRIGLVSTPAFYFAVARYHYDGGMMVSASHNPPQYNGLKIVRGGGVPVSKDTGIMTIRDWVKEDNGNAPKATTLGTVTERTDIIVNDVQYALDFCGTTHIRPLKIVADAANSMGATYLAELFKHLPCELIPMNFDLDGTFPSHEADPFKEENNASLMERVVAEHADLGIATDGDGDRIFFVDNEGKMITPAIVRGVLSQVMLAEHPGATICYDIRPGRITRDMIEEAGGKPCVTKVGHSLIKEQAIKEGAVFAGESSGHFFIKMEHGMFEAPCIMVIKLLEHWSKKTTSIADQVQPYRRYYESGEINSTVSDKDAVIAAVTNRYAQKAASTSDLDGITIEYPDFWFNVRASNTESVLRLNLEARTPELRDQKTKEILSLIRQ